MRTNVQQSSIDAFRAREKGGVQRDHKKIIAVMRVGVDYTGQELCKLTRLPPNVISARLFELRKALKVERSASRRLCPISGASVYTHRLKSPQLALI